MPIRIEWIDPNGEGAAVNVHRATSPINETSLPAPIATVNGASFYVDETVVRNQLYYYRLSSLGKAGSNELIVTPNKPIAYMPYTGPGPQTLLRGDWECGYFGRMPMGSLVASSELMDFAGFTTAVEYAPSDSNEWLKFVYKGKIIFTPKYPVCGTLTWSSVYQAGLVYGDIPEAEWTAFAKTQYGIIAQKKKIKAGEHVFTVRNPTSRGNPLNTGTTVADYMGGEWDQLFVLAGRTRIYPDAQGRRQLDDIDYPNYCSMCTDLTPTGVVVGRGQAGTNFGIDTVNTTVAHNGAIATLGWKPFLILEL